MTECISNLHQLLLPGNAPKSIFNTTSYIGTYLLQDYSKGTRYEFTVNGDFSTGGVPNKELTITIKIGSFTAFSTTMIIPYTVGGHKLTGYLLTEQTGLAGVVKLSGV